jgi:predicted DNA-binding transcriptional regulator YafY
MASPTSRLLELLQARPVITGREIADRLAVDRRTVRRDVATLQQLGIPVDGERGVGGGYRVRPGYRLPPLMLSDDEATVVVLGLAAAHRLGLVEPSTADGALAKIHRVLPDTLRRRVEALEAALAFTAPATAGEPPTGGTALLLAEAIRRRRVHVTYRSFAGEQTERELSPYGLAAHDHAHAALRTFHVDRVSRAAIADGTATAPPHGFDAIAHVSRSLGQVPWPWEVEVLLQLPVEEARRRIPGTLAELGEQLGLTSGSVTTMLDRLQQQGYLTRTPDPTDRRKVLVRATPKATHKVWVELYQPLVTEGFQAIAHYGAAELTVVGDYLRRGRQLHQRHLTRVRAMPPAKRPTTP